MKNSGVVTLDDFIIKKQSELPFATGELSAVMRSIGVAAKIVNRDVNKAGLVDILGEHGSTNVQGESVQKLDVFANETLKDTLMASGECCGIASEEEDSYVTFTSDQKRARARYVVLFDPLDGSSNIDVNVSIGTIFSIYQRKSSAGEPCTMEDFLQPGTDQVASGYVIYGSSTMLVYTTGSGVNGFTLDPSIGEFCLSHPDIKTPVDANVYSVNQGYYKDFSQGMRNYLDHCENKDKPYKTRYIGSMVADFHRNLIKGGVFIYPVMKSAPEGKLRLMYECNPLAWIIEQAGGVATDGNQRIMEIEPTELHQRVPIIVGSKKMVEEAQGIIHKA